MIRFIWNNWWRRKERLFLLFIGALIISAGLTYLVGVSDTSRGTIENTLQESWAASYDILVRPEGSRSITEEQDLLEPNYLSGLDGGISMEQYENIKGIEGIEIAAPISMIGYASYTVDFDEIELEEDGVYRRTQHEIMNNGIQDVTRSNNSYFIYGDWPVIEENLAGKTDYGVGAPSSHLSVFTQALLAGIDPEQEAKLVGLDEAVVTSGDSRYFEEEDSSHEGSYTSDMNYIGFPVIVSNHAFDDKQVEFTIERLDIPFDRTSANDVLESIKENGGSDYLETIEGHDATNYSYTSEEAFSFLVNSIIGIDPDTEAPLETDELEIGEVRSEEHTSEL